MSKLIDVLVAILQAIFGKPEEENEQTEPVPFQTRPRPEITCINPDVLDYLLMDHNPVERLDLETQIVDHQEKGETEFTIATGDRFYTISNGQIIGAGRGKK